MEGPEDRSQRLNRAIADFFQRGGNDISSIISKHPDLASELHSFAKDFQLLQRAVAEERPKELASHRLRPQYRSQPDVSRETRTGVSSHESQSGTSNSVGTNPYQSDTPQEREDQLTNRASRDETASSESPTLQRLAERCDGSGARLNLPCRFGDYELLEQVAFGGMGVVYKARDRKLDRIVAIKMILAGKFATQKDVERFIREARAAGALEHRAIVPVFDVGSIDGQYFYAMAFVHGGSLSEQFIEGPLEPRSAALLSQEIAEAVQFAHDRGVIHRDLKPGNVLVGPDGAPRITDFGLASREGEDQGLTATGQILGTPAWMPPEQAAGHHEDVSRVSDVYSIGAILYALLTGRPPFMASAPLETLRQVIENDPVSPSTLNSSLPADLETICLKCLEKQASRRYQSAQLLADDLERFLNQKPILARPIGRVEKVGKWIARHRLLSSLVATAIFLLVVGTAVSSYFAIEARTRATAEKQARLDFQAKELEASRMATEKSELAEEQAEAIETLEQNLYVSQVKEAQAALNAGDYESACALLAECSPIEGGVDRRCFVWSYLRRQLDSINPNVFLRPGADDNSRLIPNQSRSLVIALSRTGLEVIRTSDMKVVFRAGTGDIDDEFCDACFVGAESIAVATGRGTRTHPVSGRYQHHGVKIYGLNEPAIMAQELSTPPEVKRTNGPRTVGVCVAASNDGKLLATGLCDGRIAIWDMDDREMIAVMQHEDPNEEQSHDVIDLEFSPNGKQLVSIRYAQSVNIWDVERREQTFSYQYPTPDFYRDSAFRTSWWLVDRAAIAFSSDGQFIAASGNPTHLLVINNDRRHRVLTGHTDAISTLDFIPGTHRLLSAGLDRTIRYWNAETGESLPQVGTHSADIGGVVALPLRQEVLAFGADHQIRKWNLPEQRRAESISTPQRPYLVRFQPNANRLLTVGFGGTHVLNLKSVELRRLNPKVQEDRRSISIDVSPDGKFWAIGNSYLETIDILDRDLNRIQEIKAGDNLYYLNIHPGGRLVAAAGRVWDTRSGEEIVRIKGYSPSFTRDGRYLIYNNDDSVEFRSVLEDQRFGEIERTEIPAVHPWRYSADGRFMAGPLLSRRNDFVVVDIGARKVLFKGSGHYARVRDTALSPDGETIASVGQDRRLLLWDRNTGRIKGELKGHESVISGVDFSPDGTTLATTSWDNTIRLWQAGRTRTDMSPLITHRLEEDETSYLTGFVSSLEQKDYARSETIDLSRPEEVKPRLLESSVTNFTDSGLYTSSTGDFLPPTISLNLQCDFEVTATLGDAEVAKTAKDYCAIGFGVELGNRASEAFSMRLVRAGRNKEPFMQILHIYTVKDTGEIRQIHYSHPLERLSDDHHLRIVRTGDFMHFLYRGASNTQFQYLTSYAILDHDITPAGSLRFYAHTWGDSDPPSATWKNIRIKTSGMAE